MTYLDLAPAITAIRSRPEEFEISHDALHHHRSRHRFHFDSDGEVRIDALCDCSLLRASPAQARAFHAAYQDWRTSYWRSVETNREFASHFAALPLWRRLAVRLLERLSRAAAAERLSRAAAAEPERRELSRQKEPAPA